MFCYSSVLFLIVLLIVTITIPAKSNATAHEILDVGPTSPGSLRSTMSLVEKQPCLHTVAMIRHMCMYRCWFVLGFVLVRLTTLLCFYMVCYCSCACTDVL